MSVLFLLSVVSLSITMLSVNNIYDTTTQQNREDKHFFINELVIFTSRDRDALMSWLSLVTINFGVIYVGIPYLVL